MAELRDITEEILDDPSEEGPEHPLSTRIASAFRRLAGAEDERDETPPQGPLSAAGRLATKEIRPAVPVTYRMGFVPPTDIFANGTNPVLRLDEPRV